MTERQAFEVWAESVGWPHHVVKAVGKGPNFFCDLSWQAWQARAQPAQAVPGSTDEYEQWVKDGRPMPAQVVPVLTEQEIEALYDDVKGKGWSLDFARAIEQAVRAKMGVAVPMTDEQIHAIGIDNVLGCCSSDLRCAVRAAERHHGIVGKEGGNG